MENKRLRSSQPRQAAKRCAKPKTKNMEEITLQINAPKHVSMITHIRIIDEFSGSIQKSMQISNNENDTKIYIGNLSNLKDSILFIDTIIQEKLKINKV